LVYIYISHQQKSLDSEKLSKYLDNIEDTTSFLSNTIEDFTNFLSTNKKIETFYIADIVIETKALVVSNQHKIKIEYEEEKAIEFKGYKSELIQSLLVLLNNAIHACEKNSIYTNEADINSDVDILVEATPKFASTYGFGAIARLKEIQSEISSFLGVPVDLADSSGMGKTAKKFILDRAIYV